MVELRCQRDADGVLLCPTMAKIGVMTDIEFSEIRYAGKPAAFLRGFRALYLGIPINCIILGWVNLAMVKILTLHLGRNKDGSARLSSSD